MGGVTESWDINDKNGSVYQELGYVKSYEISEAL